MIRKWFNARAMTSAQPIRRARRPSHGAAAVSAAVVAPSPTEVGKPAAVSGPRESVTVTVVVPERRVEALEEDDEHGGDRGAEPGCADHPPSA